LLTLFIIIIFLISHRDGYRTKKAFAVVNLADEGGLNKFVQISVAI